MPVYRNPWVVSQASTLHDADEEENYSYDYVCHASASAFQLPNSMLKLPSYVDKQRKPFKPALHHSLLKVQFDFKICICQLVSIPV